MNKRCLARPPFSLHMDVLPSSDLFREPVDQLGSSAEVFAANYLTVFEGIHGEFSISVRNGITPLLVTGMP